MKLEEEKIANSDRRKYKHDLKDKKKENKKSSSR